MYPGRFPKQMANDNKIFRFRWTYIALPVIFLLLSIILTGVFYSKLPAEIAYHFQYDVPDKTMRLSPFIAWMIVPQVFFVILSFTLTRIILLGAKYMLTAETPLASLLPVMGNMMALPQIILFFAMIEIFLYNAYHTGIIPLLIVSVIILMLGGIVLAIYFTRILRRYRRRKV
jgi:hypothetical protein